MDEPRGWYSRGYLPHIDAGQQPQFLTWRLADSLPAELIREWEQELERTEPQYRKRELYRRVESHLDCGHGSCVLRNPIAAKIVQDSLMFGHGNRYTLDSWVVMPNHVHVLLTPLEGHSLTEIVQSHKSYTATRINKAFGTSGQFWQHDFFDRLIRDERHFDRVEKYIEWNPVKAKLCKDPKQWPFSSSYPATVRRLIEKQG